MNHYGIISFAIGVHKGYEQVRSAHIQIPIHLAKQLDESGNNVTFFTNPLRKGTTLPRELEKVTLVFIPDPRKRKATAVMYSGFTKKIDIINIIKGIYSIIKYSKKNKIDVLHFMNGSFSVGIYASIIAFFSTKTKVYWTPSTILKNRFGVLKYLYSHLDGMISYTDYHRFHNSKLFKKVKTIKHGILRNIKLTSSNKKRVTFWRDPSYENGADIAKVVFESLAKEFTDIIFTFMVRPYFDEIDVSSDLKNIEVYKFPYKNNITLEHILSETIVCIFPFREFSTNPQLSILETLQIGIPCICSDIESANEYGIDKRLLIKKNSIKDYESAIRMVIKNPKNFIPNDPRNVGFNWNNFVNLHKELYNKF